MSLRQVKWTSECVLPCVCEENSEVILCVDPSKVQDPTCNYNYGYIEATLLNACKLPGLNQDCHTKRCQTEINTYIFQYDDSQIKEGMYLSRGDILGAFCRDCFVDWAIELAGSESSLVDNEDGTATFISPHGCEYLFTIPMGCNTNLDFIFGDGVDGDFLVENGESLTLPLARNYYFENVTIDEGGSLMLIGPFPPLPTAYDGEFMHVALFVSGTLTINGNINGAGYSAPDCVGAINLPAPPEPYYYCSSSQGGYAATGPADDGGFGEPGPGGWSIGNNGCGGKGRTGSSGSGTDGRGSFSFLSQAGGRGGAGGNGGGGVNGGDGGIAAEGNRVYLPYLRPGIYTMGFQGDWIIDGIFGGTGGAGGGGGGKNGGDAEGGMGAGGGMPGATIQIFARNIIIGSNGGILANGGDGGNGADATGTSGDGGGGGGGGGAGGGMIYLVYETLVNNGIITAAGGAGGIGGQGLNSYGAGQDGEDGEAGSIYKFNLVIGAFE